jgi:hypothetical protein
MTSGRTAKPRARTKREMSRTRCRELKAVVVVSCWNEVISALLNLRLKEELGGGRIRASASAVFRESEGMSRTRCRELKAVVVVSCWKR